MIRHMMRAMLAVVIFASLAYSQTDANSTKTNEARTLGDDYFDNSTTTNTSVSQPSAIPGNTTQQNATAVEAGGASGTPDVAQNDTTDTNQVVYQSNTTAPGTSKDDFEEKYKTLESK